MKGKSCSSFPLDYPHVWGQCISRSNNLAFFGGRVFGNQLDSTLDINKIDIGKVYIYSCDGQIYESADDFSHTQMIGATVVYNPELNISITFGGITKFSRNNANKHVPVCTSNVYVHRWSNLQKDKNTTIDFIFNAKKECSFLLSISDSKETFAPSLGLANPCPRCFHSAAWDSINNRMWIFGGIKIHGNSDKKYLNDTWAWSLQSGIWTKIEIDDPPTPRAGSSMTYINGCLYMYGGFSPEPTNGHFFILDIKNNINGKPCWKKVSDVPNDLCSKICGARIDAYSPSLDKPYIIFSGGSQKNLYGHIPFLQESKNAVSNSADTIYSYSINSKIFNTHQLKKPISEISYHTSAIVNDRLHLIGGLTINDTENRYQYHNFIFTLNLLKLFSNKRRDIGNFIVSSFSPLKPLSVSLDNEIYQDFRNRIKEDIENVVSKVRVQNLYQLFNLHQKEHYPLTDFIIVRNWFVNRQIISIRLGPNLFPANSFSYEFYRDLIFYSYTDTIDPSKSTINDFYTFLDFLEFCRERRLYRLIALEIGIHVDKLSPYEFMTLCLDTKGFPGQPFFNDENLSFLKTLFTRALPKYHFLADFSKVDKLSDYKIADFLINAIHQKANHTSLEFSESRIETDLSCISANSLIQTLNGPICVDDSALKYDQNLIKRSSFDVVRSVETSQFDHLFFRNDTNEIFMAFQLICSCKTFVDQKLLEIILNGSRSQFVEFASKSVEIKNSIKPFLHLIKYPSLLVFALEMMGSGGETIINCSDNAVLKYDFNFGIPMPSLSINIEVSRSTLSALLILMYQFNGSENIMNTLPSYFNKHDLADELLTLSATCSYLPPSRLRPETNKFICDQLFENIEMTEELFIEYFPKLFDAGIHEQALKDFDVLQLSIFSQPSFFENLTEEQTVWFVEKSNESSLIGNKDEYETSSRDESDSDVTIIMSK